MERNAPASRMKLMCLEPWPYINDVTVRHVTHSRLWRDRDDARSGPSRRVCTGRCALVELRRRSFRPIRRSGYLRPCRSRSTR